MPMNLSNKFKPIVLVVVVFLLAWLTAIVRASNQDVIVGVWQVKTDYYQAVFEIESYADSFVGKVYYYNDGQTELTDSDVGTYFISDLKKQGNRYMAGKMYMPDGSYYEFNAIPLNDDQIKISMTIDGELYTEQWQRYKVGANSN